VFITTTEYKENADIRVSLTGDAHKENLGEVTLNFGMHTLYLTYREADLLRRGLTRALAEVAVKNESATKC
jgi:hypothetical protein